MPTRRPCAPSPSSRGAGRPSTTSSAGPRRSPSRWSPADRPATTTPTREDRAMTAAHTTDTVVIGAGHAGLAVSRLLERAGREHVVLDGGRVGERWRTARWDSLHLLTPNWMTRLPGSSPEGDPEAYLPVGRFVRRLEEYAASFDAPVVSGAEVTRLKARAGGYDLLTNDATWRARSVVVATGPHGRPVAPAGLH